MLSLLISSETRRNALFDRLADHPDPIVRSGVRGLDVAGQKSEKGGIETTLIRELRSGFCQTSGTLQVVEILDFDEMFMDRQPYCIYVRTGGDAESAGSAVVRIIMGNAIFSAKRFIARRNICRQVENCPRGFC